MPFLIGTDEAGYGPNLGPLVISASVWELLDGHSADGHTDDLYHRLAAVIARTAKAKPSPLVVADSKVLYKSGKGLKLLERGLWSAWSQLGLMPTTCGRVWELLTRANSEARHEALCGGLDSQPAPCDADLMEIAQLQPGLGRAMAAARVRLVAMHSAAIFPRAFNAAVERGESKGTALSRWTLRLVAESIEPLGDRRISIVCDKHGGRDRYLPLLSEAFPNRSIEVCLEGRRQSVYRFGPAERRIEISFQAKGESHLPTALASMASKYLRELAMHAFNAFWRTHLPSIRPTAGYPEDAKRFKAEIADVQQSLGIADTILWRTK